MSDLRKKAMTRLVLCAVALVASIIFSVLLLTGNLDGQTGSGDTAHGSSCCDLQKSFTGDLFHNNSFLFLIYPSHRQKSIAVLVKSITFTNKEKEDIISL